MPKKNSVFSGSWHWLNCSSSSSPFHSGANIFLPIGPFFPLNPRKTTPHPLLYGRPSDNEDSDQVPCSHLQTAHLSSVHSHILKNFEVLLACFRGGHTPHSFVGCYELLQRASMQAGSLSQSGSHTGTDRDNDN